MALSSSLLWLLSAGLHMSVSRSSLLLATFLPVGRGVGWGGCTQAAAQFVWLGIQHILASPLAPYPSTVVNQPQNTSADRKPAILSLSQLQSVGQMHGRLNGWFDEQYVCRIYTCVGRLDIRHYLSNKITEQVASWVKKNIPG